MFQNYEIEAEDRDRLHEHLNENWIETLITWGGKAVHQFQSLGFRDVSLPRTEEMISRVIMLPMHVELENDQIELVTETIRGFYR